MAEPSKSAGKPKFSLKLLWERFVQMFVPPYIQIGATLVCGGILYGTELWVRPMEERLKMEKQAAREAGVRLMELQRMLPEEKALDLQAGLRRIREEAISSDAMLAETVKTLAGVVRKEAWQGKITPEKAEPLSAEVPGLKVHRVTVEVSVPPDFSAGEDESDQTRLLRLLRKISELRAKHQLVGAEILSSPDQGFSARLTYHFYRVDHG
jgi:hypothetical protein